MSARCATSFRRQNDALVALCADGGEAYVRLSITVPDDRLDEGVRRIESLAGSWR
jgi:aspartate/methionine/tyrosine aminotransferase